MSISFHAETKQFYLHTQNTSYVMELYDGHLAHSYWGSRVGALPTLDRYGFPFGASFSSQDICGMVLGSTDKLTQEYPTYGTGDMRSPYAGKTAAYEIISDRRVLVFILNITGTPCQAPMQLKLQGLEPDAKYQAADGTVYEGRTLMGAGILMDTRTDYADFFLVYEKLS